MSESVKKYIKSYINKIPVFKVLVQLLTETRSNARYIKTRTGNTTSDVMAAATTRDYRKHLY